MAILVMVGIVVLVLLVGGLLAFVFSRADRVVTETKEEIVAEERAYNPGVTMGHTIKVNADYGTQLKEARLQAAAMAAALPRGANSTIGRFGLTDIPTASEGLDKDPMTAVRIAQFHGWDGARTGIPVGGVPETVATPAAGAAAPAADGPIELVPGRDYPVIEITDGMSPEETRKARIANAKARSAAMKAAKEAQNAAGGAPVAATPAAPSAAAQAAAPATAAGVAPPTLIEITDDMPPEEVRKARIANAKAQSAYNKALKAAGVDPAVAAAAPAAAAPVAAAATATAASPAVAAGIDPPDLIEITDDMPPEEVRKARVANAKAQSAYNKALKVAGIVPATTESPAPAPADAPAASEPAAAAPAESASRSGEVAVDIDAYVKTLEPEELSKFQANIEYIEDVTEEFGAKMRDAGIDSPLILLRRGATPSGRKQIAAETGLDASLILTWVNHCDLYRIKGVSEEYADLLEEAGVDTVVELAQRNASSLAAKLAEVNEAKSLVKRLPPESSVQDWVEQAKTLPRAVFYADGDAPAEARVAASTTPAPPSPSVALDAATASDIEPPTLVEITDDMSPDEIRQARISNAKANSAFNKALKAAGIDPASLR